jgi:hypothetical protein
MIDNNIIIGHYNCYIMIFTLRKLYLMFTDLENHNLVRNIMIWICFLFGLYNTLSNNLTDLYETNIMINTLPIVFMGYLTFDLIRMNTNKKLFRLDLILHHIVCLIAYLLLITSVPKIGSWLVLAENISLLNHIFKDKLKILLYYRIFIIIFWRIPEWICMLYIINFVDIYYNQIFRLGLIYRIVFSKGPLFFIAYDLFLLKQMFIKMHSLK